MKTGNDVHTAKSRTRMILFQIYLAHFLPKYFGGFLLTQLKDFLSYWHHTVKHLRRKYT
jgi:hypothetical protein